jgi:hypothetical protein
LSKPVTNVAASVRQRLLNLARESKQDFGLLLTKYALERLLLPLDMLRPYNAKKMTARPEE